MDCREFENQMADYLGEELPAEARAECEAHLASCAACRERAGDRQTVIRTLRRLETVSPELATRQTAALTIVRRSPFWLRIGGGILKVAAVLAIGIVIGRHSRDSQAPPQTTRSALTAATAPQIHPDWIELGRQVSSGDASLAQYLTILARTVSR